MATISLRPSITKSLNQITEPAGLYLMAGSDNIDDREVIEQQLNALNINADNALLDADVGSSGQAFSGDQRQRLCIARLLLSHPDIILMDEPTANLDHIIFIVEGEVIDQGTHDELMVREPWY